MTNELTVYENVTDPLAFMREMGTEIAQSRMFGCANEAQGKVLAMACMCERKSPIEIARKYHIIQNNLSMRADAMLAELRGRGGKHKVIERTAEKAEVELTFDGQTYREALTWEDAQQERYVYGKDGKTPKDNWATPRSRRQMLWARVISEACRTLCPEIVAGTYTPEETHDFAEEATTATKVDAEQLMRNTAAKVQAAKQEDVVDAEFEVKEDSTPIVDETTAATTEQRKKIRSLFDALGVTDVQVNKALDKRGVKRIRDLTKDQAVELIDSLSSRVEALAEKQTGESRLPETHSADETSPVSQVLIDEIKALLKDDLELMKRIKEHLVKHGMQKISDMSHKEALELKQDLESDSVDLFFKRSLIPF